MNEPTPTSPLERFTRYTTGREPVLTVNVVAALILAVVVKVSEPHFAWDELSLTIAGLVTLAAATWLARQGVWSPVSHDEAVEEALETEPPSSTPTAVRPLPPPA